MQFQELFRTKALFVKKTEIEDLKKRIDSLLLFKSSIPNIIQLSKEYETFTILEKDKLKSQTDDRHALILLKDNARDISGFQVFEIQLVLNANFFSHSELIFKLTNGNVQFSGYEMIGDIIHLNLTEEQQKYKKVIADVLHMKTGRTVINKTGKIKDIYRFYESEHLAGKNMLTTVHNENGIKYFLDLGSVYWCSRLQSERMRIAKAVGKNQVLCDPFCGAGAHVLPALKNGAKVLCNDLNPSAIECLKKSLKLNKLECSCIHNMDASEFLVNIKNEKIDHFVFNLPEYSLDYVKFVRQFPGVFWLHVFFFCKNSEDPCEEAEKRSGCRIQRSWVREVRKVSPSKSVFKLEIQNVDLFSF